LWRYVYSSLNHDLPPPPSIQLPKPRPNGFCKAVEHVTHRHSDNGLTFQLDGPDFFQFGKYFQSLQPVLTLSGKKTVNLL
jgi:hypothetical protein